MRDTRPSFTAAFVAACRGVAGALPLDARLVDDPFAARFAGPGVGRLIELARSPDGDSASALRSLASNLPFVLYIQVRTRTLDDAVDRFARDGATQVVLLGAGFDARATRFPSLRFFEVDHPATQAKKRRLLGADGAKASAGAIYVSWNFERDAMEGLPDALAAHGHDRSKPTLTIWEGVTMYLTEPAIHTSVAAIRAYSAGAAGRSKLAMTYFDRTRITSPTPLRRLSRAVVAAVGEPFRFGFAPSELAEWFADRGFQLDEDHDIRELAQRLLPPSHAARIKDGTSRIALASV